MQNMHYFYKILWTKYDRNAIFFHNGLIDIQKQNVKPKDHKTIHQLAHIIMMVADVLVPDAFHKQPPCCYL